MAIGYNLYFDKLPSDLKAAATRHHLSENHLENLARQKGWTFSEFKERMIALKKGLIAGNVKELSYPLELGGKSKVKAAIYLANKHGHKYVINNIHKAKLAGLI